MSSLWPVLSSAVSRPCKADMALTGICLKSKVQIYIGVGRECVCVCLPLSPSLSLSPYIYISKEMCVFLRKKAIKSA